MIRCGDCEHYTWIPKEGSPWCKLKDQYVEPCNKPCTEFKEDEERINPHEGNDALCEV